MSDQGIDQAAARLERAFVSEPAVSRATELAAYSGARPDDARRGRPTAEADEHDEAEEGTEPAAADMAAGSRRARWRG